MSIQSAYAGDPCLEALFDNILKQSAIFQEQELLRRELKELRDGKVESISSTPSNRFVNLWITRGNGGSAVRGRIRGARTGADGNTVLVFIRNSEDGFWSRESEFEISLSNVTVESATLQKVLTKQEMQEVVAHFEASIQQGKLVGFIDMFAGLRVHRGRVIRFEEDQRTGDLTGFVISQEHGDLFSRLDLVDPDSIVLFEPSPREFSRTENEFIAKARDAIANRKYVTFLARHPQSPIYHRFEGWITEMEINSHGEYMFRVNSNRFQHGRGHHKYHLKYLVPESFREEPRLIALTIDQEGHRVEEAHSIQIHAYLEESYFRPRLVDMSAQSRGYGSSLINRITDVGPARNFSGRPIELSNKLIGELAAFADSHYASGPVLPTELERIVIPGSELRIYFVNGESKIRLTIRRTIDGQWRIGDTSFDRTAVDESYHDQHTETRYSTNERYHLESDQYANDLPANSLRDRLRQIRFRLLREQGDGLFGEMKAEWKKSIPEDIDDYEVMDLLMYAHKVKFYLNRGFMREEPRPLNEHQKKLLSAILFLIRNDMVFWSYNAGASSIKQGIYKRGTVEPKQMWLTGYSLMPALFNAMESSGLEYADGDWVLKEDRTPRISNVTEQQIDAKLRSLEPSLNAMVWTHGIVDLLKANSSVDLEFLEGRLRAIGSRTFLVAVAARLAPGGTVPKSVWAASPQVQDYFLWVAVNGAEEAAQRRREFGLSSVEDNADKLKRTGMLVIIDR